MKPTKLIAAAITTVALGWAIAAIAQKPDKSEKTDAPPTNSAAPVETPTPTYRDAPASKQAESNKEAASGTATFEGILVKVFPLKHARAAELASQIQKLYVKDVVADERTNMVIVRSSEYTLGEVAEFVKLLDVLGSVSATSNVPHIAPMSPGMGFDAMSPMRDMGMPGGGMMGMMRGPPSATRARDYFEAEQRAMAIAAQYRKLADMAPMAAEDQEKLAKLKVAVHEQTEAAFKARQKSQTAELEQLRKRLSQIEAAISSREKNREAIINRRVEELINPDVQWDASSPLSSQPIPTPTTPPSAVPEYGQPIPVSPTPPNAVPTVPSNVPVPGTPPNAVPSTVPVPRYE